MHAAMHQLSLLSLDMPVKLIKLSFIPCWPWRW